MYINSIYINTHVYIKDTLVIFSPKKKEGLKSKYKAKKLSCLEQSEKQSFKCLCINGTRTRSGHPNTNKPLWQERKINLLQLVRKQMLLHPKLTVSTEFL